MKELFPSNISSVSSVFLLREEFLYIHFPLSLYFSFLNGKVYGESSGFISGLFFAANLNRLPVEICAV